MPIVLSDRRSVERVMVLDDQAAVRESFAWILEDLDAEPVLAEGPYNSLDECISEVRDAQIGAVLCDYQLTPGNYAAFDGATLVAALFTHNVPAVLCTRWDTASLDHIRSLRHKIPSLLTPQELNEDSLLRAFRLAGDELDGSISKERRPWRSMVRFHQIDSSSAYAIIPGWNPKKGIAIRTSDLPPKLRNAIVNAVNDGRAYRCRAKVNVGATHESELFFAEWEVPDDQDT